MLTFVLFCRYIMTRASSLWFRPLPGYPPRFPGRRALFWTWRPNASSTFS